jgi:hypothetical protein
MIKGIFGSEIVGNHFFGSSRATIGIIIYR